MTIFLKYSTCSTYGSDPGAFFFHGNRYRNEWAMLISNLRLKRHIRQLWHQFCTLEPPIWKEHTSLISVPISIKISALDLETQGLQVKDPPKKKICHTPVSEDNVDHLSFRIYWPFCWDLRLGLQRRNSLLLCSFKSTSPEFWLLSPNHYKTRILGVYLCIEAFN